MKLNLIPTNTLDESILVKNSSLSENQMIKQTPKIGETELNDG